MTPIDSKVNLFSYTEYRAFLRDWYEEAKQAYGFSYRVFSRLAGFKSSNIFKLVMDGNRNLTDDSIRKFAKGLKLNKQESEYFKNLVLFNQSETHSEKNAYYRKLISSQKYNELKPLEKDQYDYYSTWYHAVVRELLISPEFDGDLKWIAKRLKPEITEAQVKKSIQLLERLGFIEKVNGHEPAVWKQATPLITTGPESTQLALLNYHKCVLELVKHRMPQVQQEKRDVSALTLGIIRERLPQLKKKIQEFRSDVLKLVSADDEPEEVVLLSMQLLPVTDFEE